MDDKNKMNTNTSVDPQKKPPAEPKKDSKSIGDQKMVDYTQEDPFKPKIGDTARFGSNK